MKLKSKILYIALILAVLSNAFVHMREIEETRLNTIQTIANSNIITFSNNLIADILTKHLNMINGLYNRVVKLEKREPPIINIEKYVPDFKKLMNGTVIVYKKNAPSGAGVCIREDDKYYYVLSAHHVVVPRHENDVVSIKLLNGIICAGEVIKENIQMDLSLIRITKSTEINLDIIKISKDNPQVGETVYAIGHPLKLYYVLTKGIVSDTNYPLFTISNITTIYGNSGGGLFNIKGELLGINVTATHYYLTIGKDKRDKKIKIQVPEFSLSGAVKLELIKDFLKSETEDFADIIMKIPHK